MVEMSAPARGGSMRGTLADGDRLIVRAVALGEVGLGDVVAFRRGGRIWAHRLVKIRDGQWWTQGDGNWRRDTEPLVGSEYIGRVEEADGSGGRRKVAGGSKGMRRATGWHVLAFVRWGVRSLLVPLYRLVRASRVAPLLWRPDVLVARFSTADGPRIKYIHRGHAVACWRADRQSWTCRRPYDLVLFPPAP